MRRYYTKLNKNKENLALGLRQARESTWSYRYSPVYVDK